MSLILIKPELDAWVPGEHNSTFRGNNHAMVTATETLRAFWSNDTFEAELAKKADFLTSALVRLAADTGSVRKGKGMMQGLEVGHARTAASIRTACFKRGLILELCGPKDSVVKLMPPLTIDLAILVQGVECLSRALLDVVC